MNLLDQSTIGWLMLFAAGMHSLAALAAQTYGQWHAVPVGAPAGEVLHRITFTGDRLGWIVAGRNTLLKTTDGGET